VYCKNKNKNFKKICSGGPENVTKKIVNCFGFSSDLFRLQRGPNLILKMTSERFNKTIESFPRSTGHWNGDKKLKITMFCT
jgi:hypothetical protein